MSLTKELVNMPFREDVKNVRLGFGDTSVALGVILIVLDDDGVEVDVVTLVELVLCNIDAKKLGLKKFTERIVCANISQWQASEANDRPPMLWCRTAIVVKVILGENHPLFVQVLKLMIENELSTVDDISVYLRLLTLNSVEDEDNSSVSAQEFVNYLIKVGISSYNVWTYWITMIKSRLQTKLSYWQKSYLWRDVEIDGKLVSSSFHLLDGISESMVVTVCEVIAEEHIDIGVLHDISLLLKDNKNVVLSQSFHRRMCSRVRDVLVRKMARGKYGDVNYIFNNYGIFVRGQSPLSLGGYCFRDCIIEAINFTRIYGLYDTAKVLTNELNNHDGKMDISRPLSKQRFELDKIIHLCGC